MRVMIEVGYLFDLRQQPLVNLRHIRPWQGTRLAQRCRTQPADRKHTQPNPPTHETSQSWNIPPHSTSSAGFPPTVPRASRPPTTLAGTAALHISRYVY